MNIKMMLGFAALSCASTTLIADPTTEIRHTIENVLSKNTWKAADADAAMQKTVASYANTYYGQLLKKIYDARLKEYQAIQGTRKKAEVAAQKAETKDVQTAHDTQLAMQKAKAAEKTKKELEQKCIAQEKMLQDQINSLKSIQQKNAHEQTEMLKKFGKNTEEDLDLLRKFTKEGSSESQIIDNIEQRIKSIIEPSKK